MSRGYQSEQDDSCFKLCLPHCERFGRRRKDNRIVNTGGKNQKKLGSAQLTFEKKRNNTGLSVKNGPRRDVKRAADEGETYNAIGGNQGQQEPCPLDCWPKKRAYRCKMITKTGG